MFSEYNFIYKKALSNISDFLDEIIGDYGLGEITFEDKYECVFNPSFKIKVSGNISPDQLIEISDDIFKRVGDFAQINNIEYLLDDLSIILCR